jgi:hypothetical protein
MDGRVPTVWFMHKQTNEQGATQSVSLPLFATLEWFIHLALLSVVGF